MADVHRLRTAPKKAPKPMATHAAEVTSQGATIIDLETQKPKSPRTFSALEAELRHHLKKAELDMESRLANAKGGNRDDAFASTLTAQLLQAFGTNFYQEVLRRLAAIDREADYDEFGLDTTLVAKIKPLFDFLYYKYWRINVTGIENIPAHGPAIIVANHSGTLPYDGAMIKTAILNEHPIREDARFLVEDFVYHFPFLGTLMYRIGGVRACQENAERLLTKDHLVIVFPEGVKGIGKRFKDRYELQRFGRGGFIRLALRTGAPIIPVAVVGAEEIHPLIYKSTILAKPLGIPYVPITPTLPLLGPLGLIPLPSKWSIHFGKPIYVDAHKQQKETEALYVHQMSESVRTTIQTMIDAALKKRKSVWRG